VNSRRPAGMHFRNGRLESSILCNGGRASAAVRRYIFRREGSRSSLKQGGGGDVLMSLLILAAIGLRRSIHLVEEIKDCSLLLLVDVVVGCWLLSTIST
jgi:hypothetical protein